MWRFIPARAIALVVAAATVSGAQEPSSTSRSSGHHLTYETKPGEHPLEPTLRLAQAGLKRLEGVKDYSANLVRRERLGGKLLERQYQFMKVRHDPLSVYVYYQTPKR